MGPGALPQAFFFVKICVFGLGTLPQAFFLKKNYVFGPGTLPQAPLLLKMKVNVSPLRKTIFFNCVPSKSLINWFKTLPDDKILYDIRLAAYRTARDEVTCEVKNAIFH